MSDRDPMHDDEEAGNENDIAIVGMAMRVPGAQNHREFWNNLRDGVESVQQLTEEELLEAGESPEALRHPDYVRATGSLDNMPMFDGEFLPVTGQQNSETAVEVVNDRVTRISNRRDGRVYQVIINTLSEDGNSISNEYIRLDEDGKITRVTHAIYDRQR